jgi:hypothetical protein
VLQKICFISLVVFLVCLLPQIILSLVKVQISVTSLAPYLGAHAILSDTLNLMAVKRDYLLCGIQERRTIGRSVMAKSERSPSGLSPAEIKLESLTPDNTYLYQVYARLKDGREFEKVAERDSGLKSGLLLFRSRSFLIHTLRPSTGTASRSFLRRVHPFLLESRIFSSCSETISRPSPPMGGR